MEFELWWVWVIIGVVFIIGEIFTAGFFLIWFGIAAIIAGIIAFFELSIVWQGVAFVIISAILLAGTRRLANRFTKKQPPGIGADRFIDKTGVVLEEIDNDKNTGRIRVEEDEWRADSLEGNIIPKNSKVQVIKVEGTHMVVIKVE
ncbi:MAG: NfeD family protein [Candidatus Kappaea frigidicola]|nr:NfeD family protein [Candidatus Kappaea frigidicola]